MQWLLIPCHGAVWLALLKITGRAVYLNVAFTDAQGREVEIQVSEDAHGKRGFPLLAPVGAGIGKPARLFLVYMPGIDLVRRTGSLVEGRPGALKLKE